VSLNWTLFSPLNNISLFMFIIYVDCVLCQTKNEFLYMI
jgi:hypothetical protein